MPFAGHIYVNIGFIYTKKQMMYFVILMYSTSLNAESELYVLNAGDVEVFRSGQSFQRMSHLMVISNCKLLLALSLPDLDEMDDASRSFIQL